jgi:hypothetical protein
MSKLSRLSLSRGVAGAPSSLKNIKSETLEEINVVGMDKHCWCEGLLCPSLKFFRCRGGLYGNGIRPQSPERGYSFESYDVYGTKRASEFPCEGVYVPDSCIFDFQEW